MSDYNDGIIPEPCLRLDYGFGQEYASVELGDGTGYVRVTDDLRSEHHKMKRWYEDVLKEALDENAKLREERNHWHVEQVHAYGNWEDTYKRAVELESENAKLRELISNVHEALRADKAGLFHRLTLASMEDDMRKLGLVVE